MTVHGHTVERLEALLVEQSALRRVATLVAADPDPSRLFDAVCEELGTVLGVESTDMVRFDDGETATVVGNWTAEGAPSFPVGTVVSSDGDTVTAKIRRTDAPARVDDYTHVAGTLAARLREARILSAVGAPIHVAGRSWGAIMSVAAEPHAFPPGTEDKIASFAELVNAALANADARAELAASRARILEAGYEERRRLERDLHDGAQQEFVSAALNLRLARERFDRSSDEALALVDGALDQLQSGLQDLRELAAGIHPSVLSDRGLKAAIESLAARSAVPVELGELPDGRLPGAVELTAYFIVAEALTNAAKHARAGCATVATQMQDGHLLVEVGDDGVGGATLAGGSGLRGLEDRVSALRGQLAIDSPAGGGTRLTARLPI